VTPLVSWKGAVEALGGLATGNVGRRVPVNKVNNRSDADSLET
jgi:hypothetical protein